MGIPKMALSIYSHSKQGADLDFKEDQFLSSLIGEISLANQINRHRKRSTVAVTTDNYLILGV